jgi:hypothetical protein
MCLDAANTRSTSSLGSNVWLDLSGNDNHVTLENGPTFSSFHGGVMVFDGVNDHGRLDVDSWIRSTSFITMSGWWYHNAAHYGAPFGILTDTSPTTSADGFWWHDSYDGYILYLRTEDSSAGEKGVAVPAGVYVSAGNWYHVALVVGTNTFDLYYNGVLYYSWTSGLVFDWSNINSDTAILRLTEQHDSEGNGSIGNVQLYNRALSATEILQNYNAQKGRFGL